MRAVRAGLLTAGLLMAAPSCIAGQVTTSFTASATVVRGCAIAVNDLAFGNYLAVAVPPAVLASTTIRVTCEVGDTYSIGLDAGNNSSGQQRRMRRTVGPAAYLNYNLFQDAALSIVWRDTGLTRVNATGIGAPQQFTVYGQLPGGQVVPIGAYLDTVTVTVRN